MTKFMAGAYLILKLICQRIEIDPDLVLVMWCNRPAIEIYEPGLSIRQSQRLHHIKNILPHAPTEYPIVPPLAWECNCDNSTEFAEVIRSMDLYSDVLCIYRRYCPYAPRIDATFWYCQEKYMILRLGIILVVFFSAEISSAQEVV